MIDCYSTNENHILKLLFYFQMKFQLCEANADQAASFPLGPGSIPATGAGRRTRSGNFIYYKIKAIQTV